MTKDLYVDIYNLITDDIEAEKDRKEDLIKIIIDLSECQTDISFQTALKKLKKTEAKILRLEILLENFTNEIQEP
ncbi:hypothetical protein K413DRAFT_4706 [Clostridium sp. ASBs410]|nr:hypothetical protein K413DRAFT_4706 [Clostridium sp. ASBs410]